MKTLTAACFALIYSFIALPLWAESPPPMPAATQPIAKNIERIAPPLATLLKNYKRDEKAEAEIISRNTQITIDENYFSHSVSYVAIYINSDEAVRDYSQTSISFNSFYEDIKLEFANVRTPEGTMDSVRPDATQIQSPSDENFYQDRKDLLFSLPNVRKGSVIEFQYRYTDTRKIVPNQWFDSFSMNWWEGRAAGQGVRSDAIANTEFTIIAPKNFTLFYNNLSRAGITFIRKESNNQQIFLWKGKNLPKAVLQDSMPRDEQRFTQLRASTMGSWQDIARWANQLSTPHVITDANLDALINDIRKKALTPDEKVKAVYQTIQEKVRYVFAHVGRGGYEPHNAFEVLTNGYGDCKDQTILAVTMLRKLGIKADPALVITRSRGIPDMSITSVSFDHMIVHIPPQTGLSEIWMDTSGDKGLFPGFSIGLEGQPALVVNDATESIVTIPALANDKHFVHLDLTFDKFENKNTEGNFTLKLGGEFEQRLRGMWQYSRERDKSFREMLGHIYSSAEVTSINGNNADNLWQSFNVTGRYQFSNVWKGAQEPLSYGFNITQLLNLFTNLRSIDKPKDRTQEYEIDPGYTISTHITFSRPTPNHVATLTSQGQNIDNEFFSLTQKGREENGNYIVDISLSVKPIRLSPQAYERFYEQVRQLLDASEWTVVYRYDKNTAELAALKQAAATTGKAESFIALAKLHIKNGNYSNALEVAAQAIKSEPKNAEAYYVLGLAQGYNNLLYESDKSFAKAEELGFGI
jgi:transglutaminase-like putative cysteine protease/tetratricopeptide (TPR) repeat protein